LISAKIALGREDEPLRSILVTDVDSEGEAAVLGANLGAALSQFGRHVVLIDGAGAGGTITRLHDWQQRPGLSELLLEGLAPVRPADRAGLLSLLPAGRARLEGADPDRLREIFESLAGDDGLVVVVGAPIQGSPITLALARAADEVILVARRDRSRREDVVFAGESLRLIGATLAGVIMTERGPLRRVRREPRRGDSPVAVPVEVRAPMISPVGATAGGRPQRTGRTRAATSGATRSIPLPDPDDPDQLSAP
jgi:Mrp family chromosome partitioning ATPase